MNEPKKNPALTKALSLLSKRSYSKEILREKLKEKEYLDQDIASAIERLETIGFIDDARYAENLVREYSVFKRYGIYRIKLKLREKKISDEIIAQVTQAIDSDTEVLNIDELVSKQLVKNKNLSREKSIQKVLGFLLRRGYSYDQSKKSIDNFLSK